MELRHLRYFVTVAEELHFGHAAQRLHMSQQPLSKQIRNLEDELETALFHRTKRTIRLTQAGEAFLREAQKTLVQADYAAATAQRIGRGEVGQLQVGFTGPILNSILPAAIRQFKSKCPDIRLGLRRLPTNEQVVALLDGSLDVGLLHPPTDTSLLLQEVIYREPLVVVLPSDHRFAADAPAPISLTRLASESFVLFPRQIGPMLYDSIVSFCRSAGGFSPTIVQEAFPQQTILGLVAAGIGISMIHSSVQHIRQQDVATRPLIENAPLLESAMAWLPDALHPALPNFLATTRELSL